MNLMRIGNKQTAKKFASTVAISALLSTIQLEMKKPVVV